MSSKVEILMAAPTAQNGPRWNFHNGNVSQDKSVLYSVLKTNALSIRNGPNRPKNNFSLLNLTF